MKLQTDADARTTPQSGPATVRAWTAEETSTVRQLYGKVPAIDIAASLGRSENCVRHAAKRLRLKSSLRGRQRACLVKTRPDVIADMNARGMTDAEIARAVGCHARTVSIRRNKLGIGRTERGLAAQANSVAARKRLMDAFAAKNGWPAGTSPQEVQILNILAAVGLPMSRQDIYATIGGKDCSVRIERLFRRGLLARVFVYPKHLYFLSVQSLSILEERARCEASQ